MFRFKHNYITQVFFHPDPAPGITPPVMGKEDIIKFLGDDDAEDKPEVIDLEDKPKKDDVPPKDKEDKEDKTDQEDADEVDEEDKEVDELDELEEELQEPTEEQLELVTPVRRKEILKKYPTLFKDFPYLEKAYYREQQFTELLPTIADAKEAVDKAQTLDKFELDLSQGNTEKVLQAVKSADQKAFNKMVDDYLPTLAKVDEAAYHHVIGNTIKHTIISMVKESRRSGNEALQSAAALLNQFVFGSTEFVPPAQLTALEKTEDNAKELELKKREENFTKQRYTSSHTEVTTRVNNILKQTITGNIDPKESMTEYVRKNATRDALDNLTELIEKDPRLKSLVSKLWVKAKESDYSKSDLDKIKSAYLSKARTLLPSVIKKARNEALKGMGKRVSKEKDDDADEVVREDKPSKGPKEKSESRSIKSDKGSVPAGMSTLEFLMKD